VKSVQFCPPSPRAFIQVKERRKEHVNGSISGKGKERRVRFDLGITLWKRLYAFLPKREKEKVFQGFCFSI